MSRTELSERLVRVQESPAVELFTAEAAGDPGAPCVLVIHGGPDWDHSYLVDPLTRLAVDYRVLLVDLRGCGRSTRGLPDHEYTPALATQDLVALLDDVGPAVHVLGFSYGGLLAQRLAVAAPDRVRSLIIASSSALPVPADAFTGWEERDRRLRAQSLAQPAGDWTATDTHAMALATASTNLWQLDRLPAYLSRLEQVRFSADWAGPWERGTLPSPRLEGGIAALAAVGLPVLLLHGRQDMTFPVALVHDAMQALPTAHGAILEEAGHMAHLDQPEAWLEAVRSFLGDRAGRS